MAIFLAAMYVNIPVYSNSRSIPVSLPAGTLEGHLPNGLHYLILQNPSPVSRVEFRLVMRVGSVLKPNSRKDVLTSWNTWLSAEPLISPNVRW